MVLLYYITIVVQETTCDSTLAFLKPFLMQSPPSSSIISFKFIERGHACAITMFHRGHSEFHLLVPHSFQSHGLADRCLSDEGRGSPDSPIYIYIYILSRASYQPLTLDHGRSDNSQILVGSTAAPQLVVTQSRRR
jgi:hypothetical protein